MSEITKEEALLCMEALVEGRKNRRRDASDFRAITHCVNTTRDEKKVKEQLQAAKKCEASADAMNKLIDLLVERIK